MDANWVVYIWDIKTNSSRKSMFYKKLNGYQQRFYVNIVDLDTAVAERLRGKDLISLDSDELPEDIDGVSDEGNLYRTYEYDGVLEEIPPDHRIRLNDSAYAFFEPATKEVEELLDEYEDIFDSLYQVNIADWNEIEALIGEFE